MSASRQGQSVTHPFSPAPPCVLVVSGKEFISLAVLGSQLWHMGSSVVALEIQFPDSLFKESACNAGDPISNSWVGKIR